MIILTTLLFIFIFTFGSCFNIDIDFPIIYSDTNPNSKINGSYFGFSVILYGGDNNLKPWIQIGAPRGHNTNHYDFFQPGLVYRCEIGQSCKLFLVDMRVNWPINTSLKHRSYSYVPKKDKAWVGAVMDIDDDHNRVVICAPRWINVNRDYYIQGACYWSNINQNVTRELLPLVNNKQIVKDEVYFYGMGQAGSSVHFPKTSVAQVVMGAPGVYNWKGTVVSYEDDAKMLTSRNILQRNDALYKIVTVPDAAKIKDVYSFSYLGYSISSGHFFSPNEISYVAGAPKYSYKGQILVFNFVPNNAQDIIIRQTRQGETLGEYFGASIGVADINGDKLDDLIIGAPHYTKKHDEGRIYIFYGNRRENLLKPVQSPFITGNYSGGQFGTAIQSLGDIDGDGCEDIAVGAPYEDEQHGVVYIYNGRKKGAPLTLSQRIEGKRLYFSLRGFGISFSKPADIDQNNFKDIAVGAYLSDNAVILRMRPTVILQMTVRSLEPRLDRNSTQFEIETCFSFSGRHLPSNLNISRKIVLDKELRRVYQHGHPIGSMEYVDNVNVLNNQMTCHKIGIGIKKMQSGKSGWEPIEIYVSQELLEEKNPSTPILVDNGVQAADKFCKTCPVVNRFKSVRELKIDVPFALECGDDNRCDSDLQVFAKFIGLNKDQFIIGLYKTLSLQISVLNKKEPAYLTEIEVTLPENVYLSAKPAECDDKYIDNKLTIICLIDNPLEQGKMKNVTLELDTEAITDIKKEKLPFQINAKSNSDEVNPKDNNIIKNLFLVTDASIKIIGKTEKSVYYFGGDIFANTTHVYEVQKTGVSPLNEFTLNISIPVSYKINNQEIHFLAIHKPKGFQDRQILTCQWPEEFVKDTEVLEVENFNQNITNEARKKRAINSSNETEIFDFAPLDKILFINCSMNEVVCKTISCTIGPFRQSLKGASLQIKMVMNMTQIIEHVLANNESIYLSTDGRVKEIEGQLMDSARTSTAFVKEPEDNTVESWIIIVAVVCGILILLLIIMGLVKAGFFERKQKAELEALKQAEIFRV